jgi:hypothetical protein
MIKNKIVLWGFLVLLSVMQEGRASVMNPVVGTPGMGVRDQVTKWFDEKKYLQNELSYQRAYNQLQEVVKGLLVAIKQKYSAIIAGGAVPPVVKNPKLVGDYMSGRYLKNIREGK